MLKTISALCFISISTWANAQEDASYYLTPTVSSWTEGNSDVVVTYDTSDAWSNTTPGDKITSITFEYSNNHDEMRGLTVDYLYGGSFDTGGDNGGSDHTIHLALNEYIIDGWIESGKNSSGNRRVCRINVETNLGNSYTYGPNCSSKIVTYFDIPDGQALVGFSGSNGKAIFNAGIVYAEPLKLQLQGVEFGTLEESITLASFVGTSALANYTSLEQSMEYRTTHSETTGYSDTWTETFGISSTYGFEVSQSMKVSAFETVSLEASVKESWSISGSWAETVGTSESNATSESVTTVGSLNVPTLSIYAMKMNVYNSVANVPYTVTYVNEWDNEEFYVYGEVKNASISNSYIQALDIGYITEDGTSIIYDEYYDEFSDYVGLSSFSSLSSSALTSSTSSTTSFNFDETIDPDSLTLDANDPDWIMSAEEAAFRASIGL